MTQLRRHGPGPVRWAQHGAETLKKKSSSSKSAWPNRIAGLLVVTLLAIVVHYRVVHRPSGAEFLKVECPELEEPECAELVYNVNDWGKMTCEPQHKLEVHQATSRGLLGETTKNLVICRCPEDAP